MCVRLFIFVFSFPPIHESIAKPISYLIPSLSFRLCICYVHIQYISRQLYTIMCIHLNQLSHTLYDAVHESQYVPVPVYASLCILPFSVFFFLLHWIFFPSTVVVRTLTYTKLFYKTLCIPHTHAHMDRFFFILKFGSFFI